MTLGLHPISLALQERAGFGAARVSKRSVLRSLTVAARLRPHKREGNKLTADHVL